MQPNRLEQIKELELSLWRICDEIRGFGQNINSHTLAVFAVLILLRCLSEPLHDFRYLRLFPEARFKQKNWNEISPLRLDEFLKLEILEMSSLLHSANTAWRNCSYIIGNHIDIDIIPEIALQRLVYWLAEVSLKTQLDREIFGEAFTRFIQNLINKQRDFGQFVTPSSVVELMTALAAPQPGEKIYDPCFGSGGLLVACVQSIHKETEVRPLITENKLQSQKIFGIERDPFLYLISLFRLLLAGLYNPDLEWRDTFKYKITHENLANEGFDCIIAVPPFGAKVDRWEAKEFPFRSSYSETLFLQHIMTSLSPGGRAVVALPERILFSGGVEERVRQYLLQEYKVEGVISLPENAIAPFTALKTSIITFRREPADKTVKFYQVSRLAEPQELFFGDNIEPSMQSLAASETLSPRKIVQEFRQGIQSEHLWNTYILELAERGWELVAKKTGEEAVKEFIKAISLANIKINIKETWHTKEIFSGIKYTRSYAFENKSSSEVELIKLVRIVDVNNGKINLPSLSYPLKKLNSTTIERDRLQLGDLLVSISGTIGKVGIVSEELVGAVAAGGLAVIRPSSEISVPYLSVLLRSTIYQEWFRGHARGSVIQYLSITKLRQLPVPVPPWPIQERVVGRNWKVTLMQQGY